MEPKPLSKKAPPSADADAGELPSAAQQAVEEPSSPDDAAAAAMAGCARTIGAGEDDDEQVERFYALLDNIRAMRGMLGAGGTATAAAAGRKRAREAEPPWRPAFRMEDFEFEEVQSGAPCCDGAKERTKRDIICCARRPGAARRETMDGNEVEEEEEEGVVVEAKAPRRAEPQRKARCAGVLALDRLAR